MNRRRRVRSLAQEAYTMAALRPGRITGRVCPILVLVALSLSGKSAQAADDWKFDVLRLKNGNVLRGLLVEETATEVRIQCVRRNPGSPTVVIAATIPLDQVDTIERLDPRDRETLARRLKALDPTGKREAARMEHLRLRQVPWTEGGKGPALSYSTAYFVLTSNAREDIVRRAAVRLEQIYDAYRRFLPPHEKAAKPTTIVLIGSMAEYRAYLARQGRTLLNPAYYEVGRNRIVCACDLEHLGEELERARKHHAELLDQLNRREQDARRQNNGRLPDSVRDQLQASRAKIRKANAHNGELFQKATRRLFETLYHEAFHAYLGTFVYPPKTAEVPRWLNEGLAQIFETALVEAGELRVGYADPNRLARLRGADRDGQWLALTDLLRSGPQQFLVAHASDQQVSSRHYLFSWALAYYLTFDRHLLGTPALDRYVHDVTHGAHPAKAFRKLVGEPPADLEPKWRAYVLALRPDGSVAAAPASASPGREP
jgi:hypothetical protein